MKTASLRGLVVGAFALLGVSALPSSALAYTTYTTYNVDFDTHWGGSTINNKPTATWTNVDGSGVTVTLTAAPKGSSNLTLDAKDGGIGIDSKSYEDDEIEGCESLTITFTSASPVTLSQVYLVDLFKEPNNSGGGTYLEQGSYTAVNKVNGVVVSSTSKTFYADSSQTTGTEGVKTLQIDKVVTSIVMTAPGYNSSAGSKQDHDFAVSGFTFKIASSSVPELDSRSAFGAIGLLFVGLMVGTSRRRRLHGGLGA